MSATPAVVQAIMDELGCDGIVNAPQTTCGAHALSIPHYDDGVCALATRAAQAAEAAALRAAAEDVERLDPTWEAAIWVPKTEAPRGGYYYPIHDWLTARADRIGGA